MEKVEHQIEAEGTRKRRKKIDSDRGYLIRSHNNLTTSTQGLHLTKLRNKKMAGGIFELIKLKRQIELLEKQKSEAQSKNDSSAEYLYRDQDVDVAEAVTITNLMP